MALYGLENDSNVNYEIATRANGTSPTRIRGFEFNYKQNLRFLPNWAKGLQLFANYT
jgi:hypothetical protein